MTDRPPNPGVPDEEPLWSIAIFAAFVSIGIIGLITLLVIVAQRPSFEERCTRDAAKLGGIGVVAINNCWVDFGDERRPLRL